MALWRWVNVPDVSKQPSVFIFKDQTVCLSFLILENTSSSPSAQDWQPSWLGIFMASYVTMFCFITFVMSYQYFINTFLLFCRLTLLWDLWWGLTHAESLNFHYSTGCYVCNIFSQSSELVYLCQGYQTRGPQVYFIRLSHWYYSSYRVRPCSVSKNWNSSQAFRLNKRHNVRIT